MGSCLSCGGNVRLGSHGWGADGGGSAGRHTALYSTMRARCACLYGICGFVFAASGQACKRETPFLPHGVSSQGKMRKGSGGKYSSPSLQGGPMHSNRVGSLMRRADVEIGGNEAASFVFLSAQRPVFAGKASHPPRKTVHGGRNGAADGSAQRLTFHKAVGVIDAQKMCRGFSNARN